MEQDEMILKFGIGGFFAFIVILIFVWTTVMLGVSQRAVVFNRFSGQMKGELHQGFNMINFLTDKVEIYDLKIVKTEYQKIEGLSSDMQTIYLDLTINWKLDPAKLNDIFQTIHGNIEDTIMVNAVLDTSKTELGKFRIEEIARNREQLKLAVERNLKTRLKEKYIDVVNVSIVNVDYSNEYEKSIEEKLIAEQRALEARNKKEQIRYEAEAKGIENARLAETITPLVLKQKWIEKWDGKLPQYMLGNNTSLLMNISEVK